jgi:hypothetical protein
MKRLLTFAFRSSCFLFQSLQPHFFAQHLNHKLQSRKLKKNKNCEAALYIESCIKFNRTVLPQRLRHKQESMLKP